MVGFAALTATLRVGAYGMAGFAALTATLRVGAYGMVGFAALTATLRVGAYGDGGVRCAHRHPTRGCVRGWRGSLRSPPPHAWARTGWWGSLRSPPPYAWVGTGMVGFAALTATLPARWPPVGWW